MNRAIKFRFYIKSENKIITGGEVLEMCPFLCWIRVTEQLYYFDTTKYSESELEQIKAKGEELINEFVPMQWTGHLDAQGNEVYENDIVLFKDNMYNILWDNGGFRFCNEGVSGPFTANIARNCKVVGWDIPKEQPKQQQQ